MSLLLSNLTEQNTWPQLFKKVDNTIHCINLYPLDSALLVSLILIHRIVIYPVDSAIQRLNNPDLLGTPSHMLSGSDLIDSAPAWGKLFLHAIGAAASSNCPNNSSTS